MKKNSLKSILKLALVGLSAVLLVVGLSACSMFKGESIDGNWTSPTGAKEMYEEALQASGGEEIFTYTDHKLEEIMTKAELNLNVKDDKAVFEMLLYIDSEAFFTALKEEQDAGIKEELRILGHTYEGLDAEAKAEVDAMLLTDDEMRELVAQSIEEMAKALGGTYDAEGGFVGADVFEADVDRVAETVDVTATNDQIAEGMVEPGEYYNYTYKDGVLTLKGESAQDDIVFEKK